IPDPVENKFEYARQLYNLPVDHLKVVIVDVITQYASTSPEYPDACIDQWRMIAQEAYRSILLNRYTELVNQGVSHEAAFEKASIAAAYTRDVETVMGQTVAVRNDEYPVSDAEMLEIWLDAGFNVQFNSRINHELDCIYILTK